MQEMDELERRTSKRFPLRHEIHHKSLDPRSNLSGEGETVNISSRGLLFATGQPYRVGDWIEVCINWPAQTASRADMQLIVRGPVVRVELGKVAIAIHQHEFRTSAFVPHVEHVESTRV